MIVFIDKVYKAQKYILSYIYKNNQIELEGVGVGVGVGVGYIVI